MVIFSSTEIIPTLSNLRYGTLFLDDTLTGFCIVPKVCFVRYADMLIWEALHFRDQFYLVHMSALEKYLGSSDFVCADILARSPRKIFIFIIKYTL